MSKKNLKINIKNTQLAKALDLGGVKEKLEKKKASSTKTEEPKKVAPKKAKAKPKEEPKPEAETEEKKPVRRVRARSKSAFVESEESTTEVHEEIVEETPVEEVETPPQVEEEPQVEAVEEKEPEPEAPAPEPVATPEPPKKKHVKLGPTGKHISDYIPEKKAKKEEKPQEASGQKQARPAPKKEQGDVNLSDVEIGREGFGSGKKGKGLKFKEYRDVKPAKRHEQGGRFDSRARQGLSSGDDEGGQRYRKKRSHKRKSTGTEETTIRPTSLKIRIPITIKDLASEMKLKASELIAKLFAHGMMMTINDILEDETTIQILGEDLGCEISIDTTEEERIRVTDKNVDEEIGASDASQLKTRAPVVTFMGHVDHGKTSLIDSIRESNIIAGEAGAITQHIGAFKCSTKVGDITILDTPGHEAFSAMRARGANVTDIVVLVVAGDEGIKQQTVEAIQHAKAAGVNIIVAINKSDKPNFNPENVYRELSENELLPEAWGGQTITINCSAKTKEGIPQLLEMLALQAEVLELKANPETRARGSVLESHMHKGLGATATILVQNGTLRKGDALVFNQHWGHVKTMHNDSGSDLKEAGPATPVRITGISGIPSSGEEFIVVQNDKEAKEIAEARSHGHRQQHLQQLKRRSVESLFEQASEKMGKKRLNVVLRADVQGSVEALKAALLGIESDKIELDVIFTGIGEITESDIQLAAASNAIIIGFHTSVESHAEPTVKEMGVRVLLHDVIYHAIDEMKEIMVDNLDKIPQENFKGRAEVRATFKSSHQGVIAGCFVTDGTLARGNHAKLLRGGEQVWEGAIKSIRRVKDDVKEVSKGLECGILLERFSEIQDGDIIEAYEITYIIQKL